MKDRVTENLFVMILVASRNTVFESAEECAGFMRIANQTADLLGVPRPFDDNAKPTTPLARAIFPNAINTKKSD